MVKLVYTQRSERCDRKVMQVQVLFSAPDITQLIMALTSPFFLPRNRPRAIPYFELVIFNLEI